jgi:PAS domain S-box-containing protein
MQESPAPLGQNQNPRERAADDPPRFDPTAIDHALFLLAPDGRISNWSAAAQQLTGYTAQAAIGQPLERLYVDEERIAGRPAALLRLAQESGQSKDQGWRLHEDGTRFWAEVEITRLAGQDATSVAFGVAMRLATDRPLRTSDVHDRSNRFATLVDSVQDYAIFMLSPEGIVLSWNQGAQRLKGYRPDQIIGTSFERFYTEPDRLAGRPHRLLELARTQGRVEDEGWRVRADGSQFWADVVITSLWDASHQLIGFGKVTRDLSDRRAAEERLRQSEERLRTLVDTVKDYAIFMLAPDGTVMTWNQGAQRLKGYAPHEIIGQSFVRFYPGEDRDTERPEHLLRTAREQGRVADEGWRVRKDGSRFWADVVITALFDHAGQLIGYAKVTRDLTERRQAEQDRAARMAAERSAERFERLQVATAALASSTQPQHAADVLTDFVVATLGADASAVALLTDDAASLEIVSTAGRPSSRAEIGQLLPVDGSHPLADAWRRGEPTFNRSATANASHVEMAENASASGSRAWATLPLGLDDRPVGVLGITFDEPRALDADDRAFLLALAEAGAQALDRARLSVAQERARAEAETAERVAWDEAQLVETLHSVSLALSAELDLDTVVQAVTDAATAATGAQFGSFFYNLVDQRGESYTLYTLSGAPREAFEGFPMPRNTAVFGPTFRGEGVVRSDDIRQDPRYGHSEPYRGMPSGHLPVRSYLAVPVVSRSGEVLGGLFFGHEAFGVFTDRAERFAVGIAAQAAVAIDNARLYQQVQEALRTRDEFLAAAAHDLKTPLASTKGIAQLLKARVERMQIPDGARITNGLARIDESVERMTALINDLLDLGRLQMGRQLELELQSVDLAGLIGQVVADHEPTARRHSTSVRLGDAPLVGHWDPARLRRVFDNLLSNAIKYSPEGGEIVIRAERQVDSRGAALAIIEVSDQGVGIPAADLPYVFERFRRGGNVGFAHGTGIGLGIARSIVEQHGGSISVTSTEGTGSTFSVRLPLD